MNRFGSNRSKIDWGGSEQAIRSTSLTDPGGLIETHDCALAGDSSLLIYRFPHSAPERWGFDHMWNPMADLTAGRLHNLYHYNRPLYLYMELSKDNDHSIALRHLATVRHLSVGNCTAFSSERQASVQAKGAARVRNRDYFTCGQFVGNSVLHLNSLY